MSSRIDWPFFSHRRDFALPLPLHGQLKVLRVFGSGFDADFNGRLLFFATETDSLHPLSFLVPAMVPEMIEEGASLTAVNDRIAFCATGGKEHVLRVGELIEPCAMPGKVELQALRENLATLHSNLKVFGRSSIVLDLIMGCNSEKNILAGAEMLVLEPEPDMGRLMAFIGAGEGLTPAFDDFLTGILLADRAAGLNGIKLPASFFESIRGHTTIQSVQQLEFAAHGKLSLRFESFTAAMVSRKLKSAEIVKLLHHGHSSGTDILCGIWHFFSQRLPLLTKADATAP